MKKLNKKTGFTLAELLIVVAIIAIMVAIGIPAFSTAMERSRETVDLSSIRGAYAEFMAGTLGGTANTGYYKVNIKQRQCKDWVIDTNGFLTNIVEYDKTDKKYVTPTQMPNDSEGLATGDIWVKFTTKGVSTTTTTTGDDGNTTSTTVTNDDSEKPVLTFIEHDATKKQPKGVTLTTPYTHDSGKGVVAPLKEKESDPTKVEVDTDRDWYLTAE